MIYLTDNDERFVVSGPEELVSQMREASYTASRDEDEFMSQVADRVRLATGELISFDSAEGFVSELIRVGFVKQLADEDEEESKKKVEWDEEEEGEDL